MDFRSYRAVLHSWDDSGEPYVQLHFCSGLTLFGIARNEAYGGVRTTSEIGCMSTAGNKDAYFDIGNVVAIVHAG